MRQLLATAITLSLLAGGLFPAAVAQTPTTPLCFNVPGITNCIAGRFRQYWEENGGLPVFGYPTSPEGILQTSQGKFLIQYFERNRFELHPEKAAPYDVLLGRLGDEQLAQTWRDWFRFAKGRETPGCLFFAETGHAICDQQPGIGFKSYWESHGLQDPALTPFASSLALFGLPLSEPEMETNATGDRVLTQWFERARFEWHPDKPDRFKVLLGLLGNEVTVNLVANGDFEAPSAGPEYKTYRARQTFAGWTVAAGSIDQKGAQWQAASGQQSIDLIGSHPGTIVQDLPTVAGQTYQLRFAMAGNPDLQAAFRCTPGAKGMRISWGSDPIATLAFDTTGRTSTNMGWSYHDYTLVAPGSRTRLTFNSETHEGFCGPMVDNVSLRQARP